MRSITTTTLLALLATQAAETAVIDLSCDGTMRNLRDEDAPGSVWAVREPVLFRLVLHDRETGVALTMPLITQPGPFTMGSILLADCRFRGAPDMRR